MKKNLNKIKMRKIGILQNNMKIEDEAVLSHHNILSEYK